MFLLDVLGGMLPIVPAHRPGDARRALQTICRLQARGGNPSQSWLRVLALTDADLADVLTRARLALALLD
jgi:hypothetical protein